MRGKRGAALMAVLLTMVVLCVMLKTLTVLAANRAFASRSHLPNTAALYLVETAVARCQNELAKDPTWRTGFPHGRVDEDGGSFKVVFDDDDAGCEGDESVNNLVSDQSADGPRGPGTVPPYTVDLVIEAEAGSFTRHVEVLLSRRVGQIEPYALSASGRVHLARGTEVDGRQSVGSNEPIPAGLHSNISDPSSRDAIVWQAGGSGQRATVSGEVAVAGPSLGAIDFGSDPSAYTVAGGFHAGGKPSNLPDVDIPGEISAHSGAPAPTIPSVGAAHLSAGRFYHEGDLTLDGDLTLNQTALYVNGKLTVNGSIAGKGGVFVNGATRFQGDSTISTNDLDGIVLYSKGSVNLTGFNGTQYLNALASRDPRTGQIMTDTRTVLSALKGEMGRLDPLRIDAGSDYSLLDNLGESLGNGDGRAETPTWRGLGPNLMGQLQARIEAQNGESTRDFMVRKFKALGTFLEDDAKTIGSYPANPQLPIDEWMAGQANVPGILDNISEYRKINPDSPGAIYRRSVGGGETRWSRLIRQMITQTNDTLDLNRLGTSYFQGIIYSNGYVYAANEVDILGAVWVKSDGSQPAGTTPEGETIQPGDVFLSNGVRLIMVGDYARNPGGNIASVGCPKVQAWIER